MTTTSPQKPNFKIYIITNLIFLLLIILCLMFGSCRSKPIQSAHSIERITEHTTDSVKTAVINEAILDSLFIQVAKVKTAKPECDSVTQATLDQILKQLNSRKKSGDNEAGIYYDELKNSIVAWQKVAQTQSEKTAVNKTATASSTEKEKVEIPVKYIPVWVKYLAYFGVAFILFLVWRFSKIWT